MSTLKKTAKPLTPLTPQEEAEVCRIFNELINCRTENEDWLTRSYDIDLLNRYEADHKRFKNELLTTARVEQLDRTNPKKSNQFKKQ